MKVQQLQMIALRVAAIDLWVTRELLMYRGNQSKFVDSHKAQGI
jgi:hypothetical protein